MDTGYAVPTLKFMICIGWGYKRVFEEYAQALQQRYPQLQIRGENYPAPKRNQVLAKILSTVKFALLALIVLGEYVQLFQRLEIDPPSAYVWAKENKIMSCMMIFFLGNSIEGALLQTGAFEISFNGMPVWSKLKTGRLPNADELMNAIGNQVKLTPGTGGFAS